MKKIYTLLLFAAAISGNAQFDAAQFICNTVGLNKSIHPMDFDGDGDMDIIVTNGATSGFELYYDHRPATISAQNFGLCENQDDGTFIYHSLVNMNDQVYWAFGDVNGDGLADFIWGEMWSLGDLSYDLNCRMNLGNFVFGADEFVYSLPAQDVNNGHEFQIDQIGLGDIDNDGTIELLAALNGIPFNTASYTYSPWSNIYVFDYNAATFSGPNWLCPTHGNAGGTESALIDILVFDTNNDGLNDIVTQWYIGDGNSLSSAEALSSGVFDSEETYLTYEYNWDFGYYSGNAESKFVSSYPSYSSLTVGTDVNSFFTGSAGEAPGIAIIDADNDNDGDIILPTVDGYIYYFEHDAAWPQSDNQPPMQPFNAVYQLINMNIPYDVTSMTRMDHDGDGDQDLIFIANGNIYVSENVSLAAPLTPLIVNAYFDSNADGVQDIEEMSLPYFSAFIDFTASPNPDLLYSNTLNQEIAVSLLSGQYEIAYNNQYDGYTMTTPINVELDATTQLPAQVVSFGVASNGPVIYDLNTSVMANPNTCGGSNTNHLVHIQNTGNSPVSGIVSYTFDELHTYITADPAPQSVAGNTVSWAYDNLFPFHGHSCTVLLSNVTLDDMGLVTNNVATTQVLDANNAVLYSETMSDGYLVTCAYDPNDITEHNGYTDAGYILAGDELDYTIRFQNTGNAPAQDVRIENQLSEKLDWSTMQPIAWSHDFELMIDETGRAIFSFDEINLPDSVNNEAESHGFVRYKINSDSDLMAGEIIENTAEIFFDLNPAVVTNTEVNTVFDCDMMTYNIIMEFQMCSGNVFEYNPEVQYAETFEWTLDGLPFSNTEVMNYTPSAFGLYEFELVASNPLCSVLVPVGLQVAQTPATPVITQTGNTLIASGSGVFFWSLNGDLMEGEMDYSIEMTETGTYTVFEVNNLCASGEASGEYIFNSVEMVDPSTFTIYPNPANDFVTITISNNLIANEIVITDMLGKVVMNIGSVKTLNTQVDCSLLAKGIYAVAIGGSSMNLVVE